MIMHDTVRGSELEIANESYVYIKSDSKDFFFEWTELDLESRKKLSELAGRAEDLMERAKVIIPNDVL